MDFAVQRLTTLQLDQESEFVELVYKVRHKDIALVEASRQIDRILSKTPRFGTSMVIFGYFLSCIGLTLLYRPELSALAVTGAMGNPGWNTGASGGETTPLLFVAANMSAILVSTLVFNLTRMGFILGPANLLITPLIIFLPGALLTTGMIELASVHILSGSSRLIYGAAVLLLLFFGIAVGLYISGLSSYLVYAYEAVAAFPWWAPLLGTTLFGVGTFIRLSGANRDLFWMLLVLFIAMVGQTFGEAYINSYFGAFFGAALMALQLRVDCPLSQAYCPRWFHKPWLSGSWCPVRAVY